MSRVLAGSSRISAATHERVREAVKALDYHPNAIARSLARNETKTIGFLITRPAEQAFANPFFSEAIRGVGSVVHRRDRYLLLMTASNLAEERTQAIRLVQHRRVDGLILAVAHKDDRLVQELAAMHFPFVLIGRPFNPAPISWVNNDNVTVGAMAVEHLISQGHTRIGFIGGQPDTTVHQDRLAGYRQALARAGLAVEPHLEQDGNFTREGGYRAMQKLMALPNPPTGIFAIDDSMALGALEWLNERGRTVAVVGVNDDAVASYTKPSLTTVRLPIFDLGATAAQVLLDQIADAKTSPRQVILPSQLVVRASSLSGSAT